LRFSMAPRPFFLNHHIKAKLAYPNWFVDGLQERKNKAKTHLPSKGCARRARAQE